jgi:hypothetical protein
METSELQELASGLAKAAAEWLANRATMGFKESLLSEGLLIIPAVEHFLSTSDNWTLDGEWKLLDAGTAKPGDVNIDLFAKNNDSGAVLLELKYLKRTSDQRLIKDLVKLAIPPHANYHRLLLIAHSRSGHFEGKSKSTLVQAIIDNGSTVIFHLPKQGSPSVTTSDPNIHRVLTGEGLREVERIMSYDLSLRSLYVAHAATHTCGEECVTLFSIRRGK